MALIGNPDLSAWEKDARYCQPEDLADIADQIKVTDVPPREELIQAINYIVDLRLTLGEILPQHASTYFDTVGDHLNRLT